MLKFQKNPAGFRRRRWFERGYRKRRRNGSQIGGGGHLSLFMLIFVMPSFGWESYRKHITERYSIFETYQILYVFKFFFL